MIKEGRRVALKIIVSFLLVVLVGCSKVVVLPQPSKEEVEYSGYITAIDAYLKAQMKTQQIVGLSVALIDDGMVIWEKGYGYADKEAKTLATPYTHYRAGSITKLFTATAIMQLYQKKRLNLDVPLREYLPDFRIKSRFGSIDMITLRTILSHHSGLPADWSDRMFSDTPLMYSQLPKPIAKSYVAYPPNTIYSYSNLGYVLLGNVVEKVSKTPYDLYINKHILKPLDMNQSSIEVILSGTNISKSYHNGREVKEYGIGQTPSIGLDTNVEDLGRFATMVMHGGVYRHRHILSTVTLQKMMQPQNERIALDLGEKIGLGWMIDTLSIPNETLYGHDGATVAHRASLLIAPQSKLAVVVLANSSSANTGNIAIEMMRAVWETKKGKKIIYPKEVIRQRPLREGVYTTMLGKAILKKNDDTNQSYTVKTENQNFVLNHSLDHSYSVRLKILRGWLSIGNELLDEIKLYSDEIKGEEVIIGELQGHRFIIGNRVNPVPIPQSWQECIGEYRIINQFEPKAFRIQKLVLKIEDGFLVMEMYAFSGEKLVDILKPVNAHEAIVQGLGRKKRETLVAKDSRLFYSGLRFERVK